MTTQTPTTWPNDLDSEAKEWYLKICRDGGTIQSHQRSDLDWRERKARNTDTRENRETVRFNEDELRWTQALVDAGLATYDSGPIIEAVWATPIWKHASIARDGSDYDWYAVVSVLDEDLGANDRKGTVIAFLHGAGLDKSNQEGPYAEWKLQVRHVKATDFEHDAVYLADFKLTNPVIDDMSHYGSITILASLGKAEMYSRGNDPIENRTPDDETDSNWCDGKSEYEEGNHTAHPFAPYTVKDDEQKARLAGFRGRLVRIEMIARPMVDENGKLLQKFNDDEDDE